MHEGRIAENIIKYLEQEEKASARKIKKIHIALSEFGGVNKEHFLEHCRQAAIGSRWENLEIEVKKIPFGPELEISRIVFD